MKKKAALLCAVLMLLIGAAGYLRLLQEVGERGGSEGTQRSSILEKYSENSDMIGWLTVEGTGIDYPVMRGEKYLSRDFSGEESREGCLFVEEDWSADDLCTLIYGHNNWMKGTMFHPLHRFEEKEFFDSHRNIRFYVIRDDGAYLEERRLAVLHCIRTEVDTWNYASCQYITSMEELRAFMSECGRRAMYQQEGSFHFGSVVLSTCSYHVAGRNGRLVITGGQGEKSKIVKNSLI